MDIRVSRLNQRMALQLPAELPLGLVFVVGEVQLPATASGAKRNGRPVEFYLADDGYRLPCRLSERAATEFRLEEGDMVRAGGHLVFEPALASYYLLARDIERLDGFRPVAKPLAAIIADSNRREASASVTRAELPSWVQRMAPSELRSPQADRALVAAAATNGLDLDGDWEMLVDAESAVAYPEAEPALAGLSNELIAFLSQAMDSEVEVEVTPEIMTDLNTTGTTNRLSPDILKALDSFEASFGQAADGDRQTLVQEVQEPAANLEGELSPLEIYLSWAEQGIERDNDDEEQPVEDTLTAADVAKALESTGPSEVAAASTQEALQAETKVVDKRPKVTRKTKSKDVVPWYLALLIIFMVVIFLAAFIYVALVADILPTALTLDLFQELPLLN